jgi:GTPase SAR1 family protein
MPHNLPAIEKEQRAKYSPKWQSQQQSYVLVWQVGSEISLQDLMIEAHVPLSYRFWQNYIYATNQCPPAFEISTSICNQPRSSRQDGTIRQQYRHSRLGELQGGHETVRRPLHLSHTSPNTSCRYNLGPNGGILTSLNLFATKIDQILTLLEKRTSPDPAKPSAKPVQNILVDTPGQIEVFVWSASGSILLDSLASSFPTVIAYVIDTPRTNSTSTFMSNMLYACSILYKTKLPMILVFNKTDVQDAGFAKEWMTDFEAFQGALRREEELGGFGGLEGSSTGMGGGSGYMGSLLNSMSLMLEEFYSHLSVVGVSSMTGHGVDDFFDAVAKKREEFIKDYRPELEKRKKERKDESHSKRQEDLGKLLKDLNVSAGKGGKQGPSRRPKEDVETMSDLEDADEDENHGLVDPDDDDMAEMEGDEDSGLAKRYDKALHEEKGGNEALQGDNQSFARYIQASNPR